MGYCVRGDAVGGGTRRGRGGRVSSTTGESRPCSGFIRAQGTRSGPTLPVTECPVWDGSPSRIGYYQPNQTTPTSGL